ncbi:hypothetical protein FRB94_008149 [Tulasnella sp. JGI-2019a]|nr:hypothetical protein FRB94_008149 [Tulasnella sp. JGI-2019a]KAG9018415.1 hypothetical protein FRB93_000118 [Tulasnella sp. JGI-2019a]
MTTTRLPAPTSSTPTAPPRDQQPHHPPVSFTTRPQPTHRSTAPGLQQLGATGRQPTRANTSPPPPSLSKRPPMHAGPASHTGHGSSSSAHQGFIGLHQQPHKSRSAHGHSDGQHNLIYGGGSGATRVNGNGGGQQLASAFGRPGMEKNAGKMLRGTEDNLPLGSPNPPFATSGAGSSSNSRPSSPSRSNYSHSDDTHNNSVNNALYLSNASQQSRNQSTTIATTSNHSFASSTSQSNNAYTTTSTSSLASPVVPAPCSACHQPMSGQFVRALGTVFHLDCFRCRDCNTVVASKFFPIEGPDGKHHPLCERDYFRRLNLICGKCEQALRGSYITACNKKFHVEHFTCSVCPTLFGPQDSYYEHNGDVYCHFHYSTRFATKCVGCNSAILKQFVEINRNLQDECWHPECYMIHKFWNVKVNTRPVSALQSDLSSNELPYVQDEAKSDAQTLKEEQAHMETTVYRIWTHLSAFEESSAACISDMLRHVSNGMYLEAIRMAEKFILHVEVLFAAIDELEAGFGKVGVKGMSHVREARMLCRKTVDLFTLLSQTQDSKDANSQRMGMTQELLALVTGLAHYLKILIRIALTGALKLEREHGDGNALLGFLDRLQSLALTGADPSARRTTQLRTSVNGNGNISGFPSSPSSEVGVAYGYRSLGPECAGESPFGPRAIAQAAANGTPSVVSPPSDLCASCKLTVEEDCVRLGTYRRWHSHCVRCVTCGKVAAVQAPPTKAGVDDKSGGNNPPETPISAVPENEALSTAKPTVKISSARRPPANVGEFRYEPQSSSANGGGEHSGGSGMQKMVIYCTSHAPPECRSGFAAVSRLEQYAFLLNVALRRLYLLLHKRGVMTHAAALPSAADRDDDQSSSNSYRDSADIMRMKSAVHLDRKLSATARLPKRSTIVESPTGKVAANGGNFQHSQQLQHQPQLHQGPDQALSQRPSQVVTSGSSTVSRSNQSFGQGQGRTPPPRPPPPNQPPLNQYDPPGSLSSAPNSFPLSSSPQMMAIGGQEHVIRPAFARDNTRVLVVDERIPDVALDQDLTTASSSSHTGYGSAGRSPVEVGPGAPFMDDDALTLADIPQLLESEQAREQRRSLPAQAGKPLLAELSPLEWLIIKHFAVKGLQRSSLKDQFELGEILELVEVKRNTFWGKLFKGNDRKDVKKKGVFGVPLELLAEQGTDSMLGASRAPLRVPIFIDDVISAMKQMDMSVEGIFRKNGNIRRLKELTDSIDRDPSSADLTLENPVQLAALMKKFFRDLPDPLMTFKLHKLWNSVVSLPLEDDRKRYLHLLCILLPKSHRDTMEALSVFLKWVASFSHVDEETGSKMDLQNLATVICPSILYAKGREAAREDSFTAIPVVTELLENQDEFFTVPDEFLPILADQEYFANCIDLPAKEVMKRADTYLRLKQSGKPLFSGGNGMYSSSSSGAGFNNGRGDGGPNRLAPQRSDPMLPRGRTPHVPSAETLRSPPSRTAANPSPSRERKASADANAMNLGRPTPQGSYSHSNTANPGPPSPRNQRPEQPWPMQPASRQQGQGGGNWASPTASDSRPSSFIRPNGDHFPQSANGRQSPGSRF